MTFLPRMFSVSGFMRRRKQAALAAFVEGGTLNHSVTSPTNAVCNLTHNAAGTCSVSAGVTPGAPSNWLVTGTGAQFWIRWTNTSGTLSTGTAGTWQQLNANITFGVTFTLNSAGSKVCTGTVDIATDSGGANIVATGSYTLEAVVDT